MAHHAYFFEGDLKQGVEASLAFAENELEIPAHGNPDVITLRYGLFSVDDARKLTELAYQSPVQGNKKLITVAAGRIFHEAQNALLKLFEETPEGTTLVLVIPSAGLLLDTLRSRLLPLPGTDQSEQKSEVLNEFLSASKEGKEKYISKLVDRSKSERPEAEKQAARLEALSLAEGLMRTSYMQCQKEPSEELQLLLVDLDRFIPMLHDRSAPIKLIYEHLLLVLPDTLRADI